MIKAEVKEIAVANDGSYALVLLITSEGEIIPISIDLLQARAIMIARSKEKFTRPLTHDLFKNFAESFKIKIKEIIISKYDNGIFYSKLICIGENNKEIEIDARTSDAVALSIRFNCPIYTYDSIFTSAGIVIEEKKNSLKNVKEKNVLVENKNKFSTYNIKELENLLQTAVDDEEYERASKIRDEINGREKK